MIARIWRGYTKPEDADAYEAMLKPELLPGLQNANGYVGSFLGRRMVGDEIEFVTVMFWESLEAIKTMAGAHFEQAVIPEERRKYLVRHDPQSAHYEITSLQGQLADLGVTSAGTRQLES